METAITGLNERVYKDSYQELRKVISDEFVKSETVNLNGVKTTEIIKKTKLVTYPFFGLTKRENYMYMIREPIRFNLDKKL